MRTPGSVDKTRVAAEICCHLRAICGRAAPGYITAFRRTLAFKRRNDGAKNGPRRLRGQWSHGDYPGGVAARGQDYRLPRYPHISSKNPAPVHWQVGLGKFWCFTTMPRPLYQSSTSRDRGVIFLPGPRNWPQIIADLTRCRTH